MIEESQFLAVLKAAPALHEYWKQAQQRAIDNIVSKSESVVTWKDLDSSQSLLEDAGQLSDAGAV